MSLSAKRAMKHQMFLVPKEYLSWARHMRPIADVVAAPLGFEEAVVEPVTAGVVGVPDRQVLLTRATTPEVGTKMPTLKNQHPGANPRITPAGLDAEAQEGTEGALFVEVMEEAHPDIPSTSTKKAPVIPRIWDPEAKTTTLLPCVEAVDAVDPVEAVEVFVALPCEAEVASEALIAEVEVTVVIAVVAAAA